MSRTNPPIYPDRNKALFWDDFIGYTYNVRTWAVTGGGALTSLSGAGGFVNLHGNSANSYRMDFGNAGQFSSGNKAHVVWYGYMTPATAAGGRTDCGLSSYADPTTDLARWVWEPNAHANFRCSCSNGGSTTTVDSGVVGDANYHEFRIETALNSAKFYLDGVLKTTITTNVFSTYGQPYANCTGAAAAVSDMAIDWVWVRGDRDT